MMGWTKRQFIVQAFDEIGLASYVFDLSPEQMDGALRRLDAMLASWNAVGIRIGYPMPGSPQNSDLDEQTGVPDSANEAIYTNLGIRLAPSMGKAVSPDTKAIAKQCYDTLLSKAAMPVEQQFNGSCPAGAGNKYWHNPFLPAPIDQLLAGPDSELDFS